MIGQPSYVELGVPDVGKARRFYGSVLGWARSDDGGPVNVETGTVDVGIHGDDPTAAMLIFLTVPDLEESIAEVVRAGGRTDGDIVAENGFGRFIICADDQGVRFALRQLT